MRLEDLREARFELARHLMGEVCAMVRVQVRRGGGEEGIATREAHIASFAASTSPRRRPVERRIAVSEKRSAVVAAAAAAVAAAVALASVGVGDRG